MSELSICVPYWRRPLAVAGMIENYREIYDYRLKNWELSICDDGSRDLPNDVTIPWFGKTMISSCPTKDHALNPCVPINKAVMNSNADYIALTNPEIRHHEPIIGRMLKRMIHADNSDYMIAACWDDDTREWLAHSTVDYTAAGREPVPPGAGFHFFAILHRELWLRAGGFDEDYRQGQGMEDNDWLWRLAEAGAEFVMCDDLVVHHSRGERCRWPAGGLARNRRLLRSKWG